MRTTLRLLPLVTLVTGGHASGPEEVVVSGWPQQGALRARIGSPGSSLAPIRATAPLIGFLPRVVGDLALADMAIVRKLTRTGSRADHLHGQSGGLAALRLRDRIRSGTAPDRARALWPRRLARVPELGH